MSDFLFICLRRRKKICHLALYSFTSCSNSLISWEYDCPFIFYNLSNVLTFTWIIISTLRWKFLIYVLIQFIILQYSNIDPIKICNGVLYSNRIAGIPNNKLRPSIIENPRMVSVIYSLLVRNPFWRRRYLVDHMRIKQV